MPDKFDIFLATIGGCTLVFGLVAGCQETLHKKALAEKDTAHAAEVGELRSLLERAQSAPPPPPEPPSRHLAGTVCPKGQKVSALITFADKSNLETFSVFCSPTVMVHETYLKSPRDERRDLSCPSDYSAYGVISLSDGKPLVEVGCVAPRDTIPEFTTPPSPRTHVAL